MESYEDMDFNPISVEVMLMAYSASGKWVVIKDLPSRLRKRVDLIPEKLCESKKVGWETEVVFNRKNLTEIIQFLFLNSCPEKNYEALCMDYSGDNLKILAYWD